MKKKKIIHIVEAFGGGIFTFLVDLVNYTHGEFETIIVYAEREQTPSDFKKYFSEDVKFIKSKYLTREIKLKNDVRAIKEIRDIINKEKPDIIHLHSSKAGIIGRIATKNRKIKLFYNPHGFSFLMKNASKIKRYLYFMIEKTVALKKCTIIGCSKGELEEAKKLRKDSICINNGIDIKKISRETEELKENKINIEKLKVCTVGRINYQKNPEMFNKIASENPKVKFTWIGDGELKNKLNSKNIKITGWKTRKEVLEELNNNDIFVLTSLWEGLPIALLEAMYMKKVCIVSNVIGNRDVIKNNENGFIAQYEEDYSRIINNLSIDQINRIREKAKADVILDYNIQNAIEQYKKVYLEKK